MRPWSRALLLVLAVISAACAPAVGGRDVGVAGQPEGRPDASRTLVVAIRGEPASVAAKAIVTTGITSTITRRFFNASLGIADERDLPRPYLAEALPQLDTDTWRVFADGRMETVYRLRPNLTWHDGTPLAAEDFVFSWRVYTTPDLGLAGSAPQNLMEEILALDARTVSIRWRQPYPEAGSIGTRSVVGGSDSDFPPLPRHILESAFNHSADAFSNHPYWTTEYVGLGPYRVDRWEAGAFIEGAAFDGHAFGRPRISRVKLVFIGDPNTVLANLLADGAHLSVDDSIRFQQAAILRREWSARTAGHVYLIPTQVRHTQFQLRPDLVSPRALLNVSVRRAVVHAIDRQALVDGLLDGEGIIANTLVPPRVEAFPAIDRAISKYPNDLRRTEQLVSEAGYSRGNDGVFTSASGERFALELRVLASAHNEAEQAIMMDGFRRAGFEPRAFVVPAAQVRDGQVRSTFPGLSSTSEPALLHMTTERIPRGENRWQGWNYGGWTSPEYDRLIDAFNSTLDPSQRSQVLVQMARALSEEVPDVPLYFNPSVVAHIADLRGPMGEAASAGAVAWNLHEWELG